jgi:hypothetical protein
VTGSRHELMAKVETLAAESGNATYVGLSVSAASTYLAPTGVQDTTLKGSAKGYDDTVGNTDKFCVHLFAVLAAEAAGRFVGRDQGRVVGQRAAPPPRAGAARRIAAGKGPQPFTQPDKLRQLQRARGACAPRFGPAAALPRS